eukprot:jgi/Mesen1/1602/ME000134S00723
MSNGGSIVLEETEALVTIDVNGGSGMMGQQANREAILEINLAAARQKCTNAPSFGGDRPWQMYGTRL